MYTGNERLSKNFKLHEFTDSEKATKLGVDNLAQLTQQNYINIEALCVNVLQKVRDMIEVPIHVSSGFRCRLVNKAANGATKSQHMKGEAADLCCADNKRLAEIIEKNGKYDQMIKYLRPDGSIRFIHVSWKRNGGNRKQRLVSK